MSRERNGRESRAEDPFASVLRLARSQSVATVLLDKLNALICCSRKIAFVQVRMQMLDDDVV